jgi:RHS repeat-associated protein
LVIALSVKRISDGSNLIVHDYARDRAGNLNGVEDNGPRGLATGNALYQYDPLYRLTSATLDPGGTGQEVLTYRYDSIDNLTFKGSDLHGSPAHAGAYKREGAGPHQATSAGDSHPLAYDAAGHIVRSGRKTYDWDHLGKLVRASRDDVQVADFAYDASGERVTKTEGTRRTIYTSPTFEVRDGIATTYVLVGRNRAVKIENGAMAAKVLPDLAPAAGPDHALEAQPDGSITAGDAWLLYAHQSGLVEMKSSVAADTDPQVVLSAASRCQIVGEGVLVTYRHHDLLGSAVLSTDETGAELQRTWLFPFGEVRAHTRYLEDYGFVGQELDPSTQLSYHSARYYDPHLGLWSSPDPLFELLGDKTYDSPREASSRYMYARHSPATLIDPTGLKSLSGKPSTAEILVAAGEFIAKV